MTETIVTVNGSGPTPIRITPASDPDVQVAFEVPVKGRKALSFKVPRLQYLPFDVSAELETWIAERNKEIAEATPESARYKQYDATMFLLERLLTPEQYAILDRLTVGEKMQIDQEWERASAASLGKSPGSSAI